jgi:hypothetical protein
MRIACGTVALIAALAITTPQPARADDRAAVEAGRAAGRALLILRDPKVCGIALVRDRCRADVEAFLAGQTDADFKDIPKIGTHPVSGLRAFVTGGDLARFDRALVYINTRSSTPAMWREDARNAALFDAGVEDVMLPAGEGNQVMELLGAGSLLDLEKHAAQVPAGSLPIAMPAKLAGATGITKFSHDLVAALDAALPPPPLIALTFADGPAGDAALGVASSTVAELIDSPSWLFQADAQRFLDAYTARLTAIAPAHSARIAALRSALRSSTGFSHDKALNMYSQVFGSVIHGDPSAKRVVLGAFSAQLFYNAAILRDRRIGGGMARFIADGSALDGSVAGWSDARAAASSLTDDDWNAQYQLGLRLVELIARANRR